MIVEKEREPCTGTILISARGFLEFFDGLHIEGYSSLSYSICQGLFCGLSHCNRARFNPAISQFSKMNMCCIFHPVETREKSALL